VDLTEPSQTCGCGCGRAPKKVGAEFLPGHHARVAPRRKGGGVLAVRKRSLCRCGCGGQVKTLGRGYLPGHHTWTAEWKAQYAPRKRRGEWRICPLGHEPRWVPKHRLKLWRGCDRWCVSLLQRKSAAWNDLQRRCLRYMAERKLTMSGFAREMAVGQPDLSRWFCHKDTTLAEKNLRRLAQGLNIAFERAVIENGGETYEQRRAKNARALGANYTSHEERQARARKLGLGWKGKRKPRDAIERMLATQEANGTSKRAVAGLKAASERPSLQIIHCLFGRLRHTSPPSLEQLRDSPELRREWAGRLQEWAEQVALQRKETRDVILAHWRPHLMRLGLVSKAGAKFKQARHDLIVELLATRGLKPAGPIPLIFWDDALPEVEEIEGEKAPLTSESLRQWWYDHKPSCLSCRSAAHSS
jgi:hypothetical protein